MLTCITSPYSSRFMTSQFFRISLTFSLSAGMAPSLCYLPSQRFCQKRRRNNRKTGGGEKWQKTDSSNGNGIRWAIFTCSPGSRSQQVLEEFRCPKRGPAHHENLSVVSKWQLFSSPSSSRSRCSLSKIALCSHEYFIFILLKKRSVAFVLRLLCILTRSSFLFGGKKILVKSINVMRNEDEGWTQRVKAGSLVRKVKFALGTTDWTTLQK